MYDIYAAHSDLPFHFVWMQVLVELPNKTVAVNVDETTTFEMLAKMMNTPLFLASGVLMNPTQRIEEFAPRSTLIAVTPLDGAGKDKKRKKKVKKTPKHKPHVPKKVKLAILKLYSVNGDNVDSLREYCKNCGPGVRLASHKNRKHCGRCGWDGK